jgi:hypothetical protein
MKPSVKRNNLLLYGGALAIVIVLAVGVSQLASDQPDGLEYVAEQEGFATSAEDHDLSEAPLADYGENLGGSNSTNGALAGLIGVTITLGLGFGIFWLIRSGRPPRETAGG